jgi:cell division septation protein DedD
MTTRGKPTTSRRWPGFLALAVVVSGCGGGGGGPTSRAPGDTTDLHGVSLVVGYEVTEWSLVAVPSDGGLATSRDVADPARVLWTGSTELPASRDVHVLEGPTLVLRTDSGSVLRYDPVTDSLETVGSVDPEARWSGWGAYGAYVDSASGRILEIGPDGAWQYTLSGAPTWATPVEDGGLAVLGAGTSQRGSVWLVSRGDSTPSSRAGPGYGAPGLITAWGRRIVLTAADRRSLRVLTVPSLAPAEDIPLDGTLSALVASPSSHDLYAALSAPARVVAVNRFSRDARVLARPDGALTELRAAVLGQFLLGRQGSRVEWIPLAGGSPRGVGADWREDLPMGTPAGRVLLSRGDSLMLWDPGAGADPEAVEAPGDAWWMAVRWNPAPPPVRLSRAGDDSATMAGPVGLPDSAGPPVVADSGVVAPAGAAVAGTEGAAASDSMAGGAGPVDSVAGSRRGDMHPEAGIYAIVASARAVSGVRNLLDQLSAAGYPTAIQRYLDDAGHVWYRGMVGPYPSRDAAEAAARQLRRERSLKVWVTEIRPGSLAPESLR